MRRRCLCMPTPATTASLFDTPTPEENGGIPSQISLSQVLPSPQPQIPGLPTMVEVEAGHGDNEVQKIIRSGAAAETSSEIQTELTPATNDGSEENAVICIHKISNKTTSAPPRTRRPPAWG